MKHTLALVLMVFGSFGAFANEYSFVCNELDNDLKITSFEKVLIINTEEKFMTLNNVKHSGYFKNTDLIVQFLKINFCENDVLNDLCDGMLVWKDISPFLVIVHIPDTAIYQQKFEKFKSNLKKFYDIGKRSFLTKK